jgi:hypothetical protein
MNAVAYSRGETLRHFAGIDPDTDAPISFLKG